MTTKTGRPLERPIATCTKCGAPMEYVKGHWECHATECPWAQRRRLAKEQREGKKT